jgi:hypothetical protein
MVWMAMKISRSSQTRAIRNDGDEQQRRRQRGAEARELAHEQRDDHGAHEHRGAHAHHHRVADQAGAARQVGEPPGELGPGLGVRRRQLELERAGAVDDARQAVGHHVQDRADAGQQEHRRHGELDDVRNPGLGNDFEHGRILRNWIPACAGMTNGGAPLTIPA